MSGISTLAATIAAACACGAATAADSRWVEIGQTKGGMTAYIDLVNAETYPDFTDVWTKQRLTKPARVFASKPRPLYDEVRYLYRVRCSPNSMQLLAAAWYRDGTSVHTEGAEDTLQRPVPDSLGETMTQWVCSIAKSKHQPSTPTN